ncbi:MAG: DUF4159 domain-containing protein [Beijerinckiaceae bacterium]|jgi:hypothetical protein
MLGLPLAFTVPFALLALAGLPVLYVLLRITPPRPRRVPFPPLKLILDLKPKDETPASTPWWLLLLRLAIAGAIILAMAGPVWNPLSIGVEGDGPLLIVMDDAWSAAPDWERRVAAAALRIEAARQKSMTVAVAAISDAGRDLVPADASGALQRLRALKPVPYTPDRLAEVPAIARFVTAWPKASIVWIADALERGGALAFAEKLKALPVDTTLVSTDAPVLALTDPRNEGGGLDITVLRSAASGSSVGAVRALDLKGLTIGQVPFVFAATATEAKARFDLPVELRNDIARLEIVEGHSAGAVSLLDARWKRRRVGIVGGETADTEQPLLAADYYLLKALSPFADVRQAKPGAADPIGSLLDDHVSVMILADIGTIGGPARDRLTQFVENGGLLVRFAGTRLSVAPDDLVPVQLRRGGRVLGGSLSWETPKALAAFEPSSPFAGLKVPAEVTISRQVLAEPEIGLPGKTWAQLSDGTPLVTAASRGKGKVVLFHVTADTTWSNLPISGLFVEMLRKIVSLSGEAAATGPEAGAPLAGAKIASVAPSRTLDGFGVLGPPPPSAKPVPSNYNGVASADYPPGFYGTPDSLLAVNALAPTDRIPAAGVSGLAFKTAPLQSAGLVDLRPWLIVAAFCLFLGDALATLWLAGKMPGLPRRAMAALILLLGVLAFAGMPRPAWAESGLEVSQRDLSSALTTRLAYVLSGDAKVDEVTKQGLDTLSAALASRTSLSPGDPAAVDPAKDELAFYPLLYWPVVAGAPKPSAAAAAKIAAFMRQGGTIVFDTRDALLARPNGSPTPETAWLRELLANVDVPELEPVPASHVVTKTFYLIDAFVGRYASGQTWIEALPPAIGEAANRPARSGDGVSPIIVTNNDLAGGWADDDYGEALYPLVPGDPRQHEMALRGGINLVMYTLTGNYKADQVHVRDLLERLAH